MIIIKFVSRKRSKPNKWSFADEEFDGGDLICFATSELSTAIEEGCCHLGKTI